MAEERRLVPATHALQASPSQMQDRESQTRALAHRLVEWVSLRRRFVDRKQVFTE